MKTYFIGLGGCGLQTVAEVSKRLSKEPNYRDDYAFTYVDTDMYTLKDINAKSEKNVISSADFVDMGPTVPLALYNGAIKEEHPNADTKRFLEWVISQEPDHMLLPNHPLSDGATAQRNVGRCGIYAYYDQLEKELNEKIKRFSTLKPDDEGRRDVDIWVIASSCGGTGSSMVLDVLYMINRLANPVANGEPNVKLVLYMPQYFVEKNQTNSNHKLNAYACLEELNFFRANYENGDKKTFEPYAVRPTKGGTPPLDFPLFQFVIPVCVENNFGSRMSISQLYPTIAEMIYYLNIGGGKNNTKTNLSNILAELFQKVNKKPGITSHLVGYGFRAIKKANKELKEYLTRRALYEVINYGLLEQRNPTNFKEQQIDFAKNAILNKLVTLSETIYDNDATYRYETSVVENSVESLVQQYINSQIMNYDPDEVSGDVVNMKMTHLERFLNGEDFKDIKDTVYALITKDIDKLLNTYIIEYGLRNANELLNFVDDYYLEPLRRRIEAKLLTDACIHANKAKTACAAYSKVKSVFLLPYKKAEINQAIKNYKDAVVAVKSLTLALRILDELTEAPTGYLERLRKGDNIYAGISNLIKLIENDGSDFRESYSQLAKEFRATANDVMTVYLPSLAEIATGENNTDWAIDNEFDKIYQGSVIAQKRTSSNVFEPVRFATDGKCLKGILEQVDPQRELFISMIKSKMGALSVSKDSQLIEPIKKAIESIVNSNHGPAADWINTKLADAIKNPLLRPKAFKRTEDLLDSFQDMKRVPVFFPLRSDVALPANTRLLFVGSDENLAGTLGFKAENNEKSFVPDPTMTDRFLIMRMPAGLEFNMYKYYENYKVFYNSEDYLPFVRGQYYGCHIHSAFNEYGLVLPQKKAGVSKSSSLSDQLAKRRIEALVKCLYYQHVIDLLREKDKSAYNNLFGFNVGGPIIDTDEIPEEMKRLLGIADIPSTTQSSDSPFVSLRFNPSSLNISLQMRAVSIEMGSEYLHIDDSSVQNIEFGKEHTQQCNAFVEKLLTIPEAYFAVADYLDQKFDVKHSERMNQALKMVAPEALARLKKPTDGMIGLFALCLVFWKKQANPNDKPYIDTIEEVINSL